MWWFTMALAAPGVRIVAVDGAEPWPEAHTAALTSAVLSCIDKPWWGALEVRAFTAETLSVNVSNPAMDEGPEDCVGPKVERALAEESLYAEAKVVVTPDPAWLAAVEVSGAPAGLTEALRERFARCAAAPIEVTFPITLSVQEAYGYDRPVVAMRAWRALPESEASRAVAQCATERFLEDSAKLAIAEYTATVRVVTAKAKRAAMTVSPQGEPAPAPVLAVATELAELCGGMGGISAPFQLAFGVHGESRSVMTMASGDEEATPTGPAYDCIVGSALPGLPDGDWTVRVAPR